MKSNDFDCKPYHGISASGSMRKTTCMIAFCKIMDNDIDTGGMRNVSISPGKPGMQHIAGHLRSLSST